MGPENRLSQFGTQKSKVTFREIEQEALTVLEFLAALPGYGTFRRQRQGSWCVNLCSLDIGKEEWLKLRDAFMKHWVLNHEQVFWRNGRQEKESRLGGFHCRADKSYWILE